MYKRSPTAESKYVTWRVNAEKIHKWVVCNNLESCGRPCTAGGMKAVITGDVEQCIVYEDGYTYFTESAVRKLISEGMVINQAINRRRRSWGHFRLTHIPKPWDTYKTHVV